MSFHRCRFVASEGVRQWFPFGIRVFFASPKLLFPSCLASLTPLNGARLLFTRHAVGTESLEMEDARIDFDQALCAGDICGNWKETSWWTTATVFQTYSVGYLGALNFFKRIPYSFFFKTILRSTKFATLPICWSIFLFEKSITTNFEWLCPNSISMALS